eukprot:769854_1
MDVLFFSDSGISILFNEAVSSDFLWSLVSMVIVFGIMTLHTGSFVLSGATMLEIYMSMPFAFFIFNIVFRVEFVQEIHFLTIFVLLGIGADDAFVFTDAWNQAIVEIPVLARYENMHLRMAWTHSRASKTMLITSITTSVAFFATAISGIIPIASFGIFAGCLILCNYALVCTYFPAVLVMYERNCNGKRCCKRSKSVEPLSTTNPATPPTANVDVELGEINPDQISGSARSSLTEMRRRSTAKSISEREEVELSISSIQNVGNKPDSIETEAGEPVPNPVTQQENERFFVPPYDKKSRRRVERFLVYKYVPRLYQWRYLIGISFIILLGTSIAVGTQFKPLQKPESFLRASHIITRSIDQLQNAYFLAESDRTVTVSFVWGIEPADRSGASRWDPNDFGSVVFDQNFDISSPAA